MSVSRRQWMLGVAVVMGACISPTLPLPPPDPPDLINTSSEEMVWEIRGVCRPGAIVLVKNLNSGRIVGAEDRDHDGRYFLRLEAEECDVGEVWELVATEISGSSFFVIQDTLNGTPSNPNACTE